MDNRESNYLDCQSMYYHIVLYLFAVSGCLTAFLSSQTSADNCSCWKEFKMGQPDTNVHLVAPLVYKYFDQCISRFSVSVYTTLYIERLWLMPWICELRHKFGWFKFLDDVSGIRRDVINLVWFSRFLSKASLPWHDKLSFWSNLW